MRLTTSHLPSKNSRISFSSPHSQVSWASPDAYPKRSIKILRCVKSCSEAASSSRSRCYGANQVHCKAWVARRESQTTSGVNRTSKMCACQYSKQHKLPLPRKFVRINKTGALTKGVLKPGDIVFSDQYVSSVSGLSSESRGMNGESSYKEDDLSRRSISCISVHIKPD